MALYMIETSPDEYLHYEMRVGEVIVLTGSRADANKILSGAIKRFPEAKIIEVKVEKI